MLKKKDLWNLSNDLACLLLTLTHLCLNHLCFHSLLHYVKSNPIQSFSGPYFPAFGQNTDRYSVRMRKNTDQKHCRIRTLSTQCFGLMNLKFPQKDISYFCYLLIYMQKFKKKSLIQFCFKAFESIYSKSFFKKNNFLTHFVFSIIRSSNLFGIEFMFR